MEFQQLSIFDAQTNQARTIPAIALWQPWASLMAIGEKCFETRGWFTDLRGPVIIYATKKVTDSRVGGFDKFFYSEPFFSALKAAGYGKFNDLPLGALLSIHDLKNVWRVEAVKARPSTRANELAFGDYSPGRFAFEMPLIRRFDEPICFKYPIKGPSKFFDVPTGAIEAAQP